MAALCPPPGPKHRQPHPPPELCSKAGKVTAAAQINTRGRYFYPASNRAALFLAFKLQPPFPFFFFLFFFSPSFFTGRGRRREKAEASGKNERNVSLRAEFSTAYFEPGHCVQTEQRGRCAREQQLCSVLEGETGEFCCREAARGVGCMDVGSKHNVPGDCVFWVKNRPCAGRSHGSRGTQSPDHGAPMRYSSVFSTSRCSVSQMFRSRSSFKRILTNVSVGSSVHAGGPGGGKKAV